MITKTALEERLEKILSEIGHPLDKRFTANEMATKAQMENLRADIDPSKMTEVEKIGYQLLGGKRLSIDQDYLADETFPLFRRYSRVVNGLGFMYQALPTEQEHTDPRKLTREQVNQIIAQRKIDEYLDIYFNEKCPLVSQRQFYEDSLPIMNVQNSCENTVSVEDHGEEHGYEGCLRIKPVLAELKTLDGKKLDNTTLDTLTAMLRKFKQTQPTN